MASLLEAIQLKRAGRFAAALVELEAATCGPEYRLRADVLKTELLERVGRLDQSRALAINLLSARNLGKSQRGLCEGVLGRIALEYGNARAAIDHFQRAVALAGQEDNPEQSCWAQIALLPIVSELSGPDATTSLLADIRRNTILLGDAHTTAGLHTYLGEVEAKRGHLRNAQRHALIARHILDTSPNPWLEALTENVLLAIAVLRSNFTAAFSHGTRAVEQAEESGAATVSRASLGNMGNLYYCTGDSARAVSYFEKALKALPGGNERNNATLDSLARICLTEGNLEQCSSLLGRIDDSIQSETERALYGHRYAQFTRSLLLARQGKMNEAIQAIDSLLALAEIATDELLRTSAVLAKAEFLQSSASSSELLATLREVAPMIGGAPPELHAQYERILACGLLHKGDHHAARIHYNRSKRILEALHTAPGLIELDRRWLAASADATRPSETCDAGLTQERNRDGGTNVLLGLSMLMLNVDRPELVGREMVDLIANTDSFHFANAISRGSGGEEEILATFGSAAKVGDYVPNYRIPVGSVGDRTVELVLRPKPDIGAVASGNAVAVLIGGLQELRIARAEREERATLWPVDELPLDDDQAVISGHMRQLMTLAQRIARTTVNVLITGESGTGKEILARAIHHFSDRAQKPFVTLNCAAIPRDLLESQLFGHRRGTFTGADRDYAGLIRTARDGTLFLDEIGELSLDLQPKLLRFLESGEISPLGESATLHVNVRVIAATNADLAQAVHEGRFREDLFYRLNVVPLAIRPLRERRDEIPALVHHFVARAAAEYKKNPLRVAEETIERFLLYRWPGNIRQLQNELSRMVALAEPGSTLQPDAISEDILGALPLLRPTIINGKEIAVTLLDKLQPTLARVECEMIKAALHEHHGRVEPVARALGISRKGLYLKRRRLGL